MAKGACMAKGGAWQRGACVVKGGTHGKGVCMACTPHEIWLVIAWAVCILLECILVTTRNEVGAR